MAFKNKSVKDIVAVLAILLVPVLTAAIVIVSLTNRQQVIVKNETTNTSDTSAKNPPAPQPPAEKTSFEKAQDTLSSLSQTQKDKIMSDFEKQVEVAKLQDSFNNDKENFVKKQTELETLLTEQQKLPLNAENVKKLEELEQKVFLYEEIANSELIKKTEETSKEQAIQSKINVLTNTWDKKRNQDYFLPKIQERIKQEIKNKKDLEEVRRKNAEELKKLREQLQKQQDELLKQINRQSPQS